MLAESVKYRVKLILQKYGLTLKETREMVSQRSVKDSYRVMKLCFGVKQRSLEYVNNTTQMQS